MEETLRHFEPDVATGDLIKGETSLFPLLELAVEPGPQRVPDALEQGSHRPLVGDALLTLQVPYAIAVFLTAFAGKLLQVGPLGPQAEYRMSSICLLEQHLPHLSERYRRCLPEVEKAPPHGGRFFFQTGQSPGSALVLWDRHFVTELCDVGDPRPDHALALERA